MTTALDRQYARAVVERELKQARSGATQCWAQRVIRFLDNTTLRLCQPFAAQAAALRHRQADPEGYAADQAVGKIEKQLVKLEQQVQQSEGLGQAEHIQLTKLDEQLSLLLLARKGQRLVEAEALRQRVRELMPTGLKQMLLMCDGLMAQLAGSMQSQLQTRYGANPTGQAQLEALVAVCNPAVKE